MPPINFKESRLKMYGRRRYGSQTPAPRGKIAGVKTKKEEKEASGRSGTWEKKKGAKSNSKTNLTGKIRRCPK